MLPGHRLDHPGKPQQSAAAGDVLAHVPAGQVVYRGGGAGSVQAVEQPRQPAAADALQEEGALVLRPDQQPLRPEEGVEVDEALDIQAHLVFAVDGLQADEDAAIGQGELLFGAPGREAEVAGQVIYHQHVPLVLPAGVQRGHLEAVAVQQFAAVALVEGQPAGQALDEAPAHLAAAVPQAAVEALVVGDGHFGLVEEAPVAVGPHDAGEAFAEDVASLVHREP